MKHGIRFAVLAIVACRCPALAEKPTPGFVQVETRGPAAGYLEKVRSVLEGMKEIQAQVNG